MVYQIKKYIKFLLKSTNQHGVHSPFVYNLVTKCFYNRSNYDAYKNIINYKKKLLKNKTIIKVIDLGAGSHIMNLKKRNVSSIAKNAGTTNKRAKLLYRLVNYFKFENILELGTSLGIGTYALHPIDYKANITTIEGCPNTAAYTKNNFNDYDLKNINFITGNFNDEIKKLTSNTYDFIFFDGNHEKKATIDYFEVLLKTAHNNSVFVFDDIYWSKDMTEAWELIKKHPKVTVTIDTFFWGFVFFRTKQAKEHFKVRI